jgi:hypothetical protein
MFMCQRAREECLRFSATPNAHFLISNVFTRLLASLLCCGGLLSPSREKELPTNCLFSSKTFLENARLSKVVVNHGLLRTPLFLLSAATRVVGSAAFMGLHEAF